MTRPPGTQGYADEAPALLQRYEAIEFGEIHGNILHLVPSTPSRILDIGAGTGRDAAGFAGLGHRVVAVEPTDELRNAATELHPSPLIEWLDDGLPDLPKLTARGETFDIVMLTAVWMHLDADERKRAMGNVATLVAPGGTLILSLRHGPVPPGRRMFDVSAAETIALGEAHGLSPSLVLQQPSVEPSNQRDGVSWSRLALARKP